MIGQSRNLTPTTEAFEVGADLRQQIGGRVKRPLLVLVRCREKRTHKVTQLRTTYFNNRYIPFLVKTDGVNHISFPIPH